MSNRIRQQVTSARSRQGRVLLGLTAVALVACAPEMGEDLSAESDAELTSAPSQQDTGADGIVSLEAEDYTAITLHGAVAWVNDATTGYSGAGAMVVPNNGAFYEPYVGVSPRLDYDVNFVKTGTHYVWVRMIGPTGTDDSLHVGLDGAAVSTSDRISMTTAAWTWTRTTLDGVNAQLSIATTGTHTINVWPREDGVKIDKLVLTTDAAYTPTGTGPAASSRIPQAFQQASDADGIVTMEVENYDANVAQGGTSWVADTTVGFSGSGALIASPDSGRNVETNVESSCPRLDYSVNFTKTGKHYVWVRMLGPLGSDDSVHVGLDGRVSSTADRLTVTSSAWTWTRNTLDPAAASMIVGTAGLHTVNLWMREDGVRIDKMLLTTNANYTPSGTGPAESARGASLDCTGVDRGGTPVANGPTVAIPNGGFESALSGWTIPGGSSIGRSTNQKYAGNASFRFYAAASANTAAISSGITVPGAGMYELRGSLYAVSGNGLGIYPLFENLSGASIAAPTSGSAGWHYGSDATWRKFSIRFYAPAGTATVKLRFYNWDANATTDMYFDELSLIDQPEARPWTSQYRLASTDLCKLTEADVVGPDGVVYPRWTEVGVQGGIPTLPVTTTLAPSGDTSGATDRANIQAKINTLASSGGGVLELGAGTFYLNSPVTVSTSGIVIRGKGMNAGGTKIQSLYNTKVNSLDLGVITFGGAGLQGSRILLASDARRGDREIVLASTTGIAAGDKLYLEAPASERWNLLVDNTCQVWGDFRTYEAEVESVTADRVRLTQPLRQDFPVADGAFVQEVSVIERCGIEDLEIQQVASAWNNLVAFHDTWNCWALRVKATKPGRMGIYHQNAKWCEVRDSQVNDAWNHDGGGTSYVGWDRSWDSLMEGVTTTQQRHAPLFQWGASGNVVRNSTFNGSDLQYHAGWANENLVENCIIGPTATTYGYGQGAFGTDPGDGIHGPEGPRNVIYNSDIESVKDGVLLGGSNEAYLVMYNRFRVTNTGAGFWQKMTGFDHVIQGNVFAIADATKPLLRISTPDSLGILLKDNALYGGSGLYSAPTGVAPTSTGNTTAAYTASPARPTPSVPSIYSWQLSNAK